MTIGIIGAGICGLMAARELNKSGHQVWLLEKARDVGGRMATQQVDDGVFDYGAQFFTGRSPEFCALIDEMQKAHVTRQWYRGYPSPSICKDENYPRFCGARGMTDVPQYLAQELTLHLNETVQRIDWVDEKWRVATGNVFWADALILTPPVPQSLTFFKGNFVLPSIARRALEKITYEPCWSVLAQLNGLSQIPAPGALHLEDSPLSWIADNHQKGISPRPGSVTIHASGDWTKEHLDQAPEAVTALLVEAAQKYLGRTVITAQDHYWRYAKPLVIHDAPFYYVGYPAPLFFAGDAFVSPGAGPRVEGAALSGLAVARALNELFNN
jgi:predicted NAD/FAD-dependent oxidoreductase